jgi:hypothetical protein
MNMDRPKLTQQIRIDKIQKNSNNEIYFDLRVTIQDHLNSVNSFKPMIATVTIEGAGENEHG